MEIKKWLQTIKLSHHDYLIGRFNALGTSTTDWFVYLSSCELKEKVIKHDKRLKLIEERVLIAEFEKVKKTVQNSSRHTILQSAITSHSSEGADGIKAADEGVSSKKQRTTYQNKKNNY